MNDKTGAAELSMDATNPRILYAAMWEHGRLPWKVISGGPGSGLYKSTDSGETWEKMTEGLPKEMGKMAIAVSRSNPEKVYALIESDSAKDERGLYVSTNAGKSWSQVTSDPRLVQRAWYYIELFVDPKDEHTIYVLSAPALRSIDGGKTWETLSGTHGDFHDLWINPDNPHNFVIANDGGAAITFDGGKSWSTQEHAADGAVLPDQRRQPVPLPHLRRAAGQHVGRHREPRARRRGHHHGELDGVGRRRERVPGLRPRQSALRARRQLPGHDRGDRHAGDGGHEHHGGADPVPRHGRQGHEVPLQLERADHLEPARAGHVLPRRPVPAEDHRHGQDVEGGLARSHAQREGEAGQARRPYTNEAVGAENYGTLAYVAESPHEKGVIWTGSDDGLVQLTRDGGATWKNVTPNGLAECLVNAIEVSPFDKATAYIATTRYKFNDHAPGLYKTTDYGATWTKIDRGIPANAFTRVVREDDVRRDLLFAGTELGLFISWNGGRDWSPFQLNLPMTPITDLRVHKGNLIAATSGRSFWILDDLALIRQYTTDAPAFVLYRPGHAYLVNGGSDLNNPEEDFTGAHPTRGVNPANGIVLYYRLPELKKTDEVTLEIADASGKPRPHASRPRRTTTSRSGTAARARTPCCPQAKGLNRFVWDMRHPTMRGVPGRVHRGQLPRAQGDAGHVPLHVEGGRPEGRDRRGDPRQSARTRRARRPTGSTTR